MPAFLAKVYGINRSMVTGQSQDDRSYAYCSLQSLLNTDAKNVFNTSFVIFADKEKIGSEGDAGANSYFIENIIIELLKLNFSKQ